MDERGPSLTCERSKTCTTCEVIREEYKFLHKKKKTHLEIQQEMTILQLLSLKGEKREEGMEESSEEQRSKRNSSFLSSLQMFWQQKKVRKDFKEDSWFLRSPLYAFPSWDTATASSAEWTVLKVLDALESVRKEKEEAQNNRPELPCLLGAVLPHASSTLHLNGVPRGQCQS